MFDFECSDHGDGDATEKPGRTKRRSKSKESPLHEKKRLKSATKKDRILSTKGSHKKKFIEDDDDGSRSVQNEVGANDGGAPEYGGGINAGDEERTFKEGNNTHSARDSVDHEDEDEDEDAEVESGKRKEENTSKPGRGKALINGAEAISGPRATRVLKTATATRALHLPPLQSEKYLSTPSTRCPFTEETRARL